MKEYLTLNEAAEILGVHRKTLERWLKAGVIPKFQAKPHGKVLIYYLDLPAYTREKNKVN